MVLRPFSQGFWHLPEFEISGGAFVMAAVWLRLVPIQWIGAALLAGIVHELGHFFFLWREGKRIWKIQIGAVGARIETEELEPRTEFFAALAGPAAGMILCLCSAILPRTALCALVQSIYNLLPIYPLDGGRALRSFGNIRKNHRQLEKFVAKDGFSGYNDSD